MSPPAEEPGASYEPGTHRADVSANAAALEVAQLRAERDALRRRVSEAEQIAEQLAEELGQARARLAGAHQDAPEPAGLPLFDKAVEPHDGLLRSVDGNDRLVLPIAFAATAFVVLLIAVLSVVNKSSFSPFSIGSLLVAGLLARIAWGTRVVPVEVWVDASVLTIRRGDASSNFDLTSDSLRLEVTGKPGDDDWRVRFYRRGLKPCDVDASMVDADAFMAQLRRYRPAS